MKYQHSEQDSGYIRLTILVSIYSHLSEDPTAMYKN